MFLFGDVLCYDLVGHIPRTAAEISPRPQVPPRTASLMCVNSAIRCVPFFHLAIAAAG
jgi:hypothetical protein